MKKAIPTYTRAIFFGNTRYFGYYCTKNIHFLYEVFAYVPKLDNDHCFYGHLFVIALFVGYFYAYRLFVWISGKPTYHTRAYVVDDSTASHSRSKGTIDTQTLRNTAYAPLDIGQQSPKYV